MNWPLKQAEAELLSSQSLKLQNKQQVTETENYFNLLEGKFPGPLALDTAQLTNSVPHAIEAGIPSQLLMNRPDIRQAEYELLASRADVKAARSAFYPSLNITAGAGFNAFHTQYLFATPEALAWNALGKPDHSPH
jgi:outer membrane protein TolC